QCHSARTRAGQVTIFLKSAEAVREVFQDIRSELALEVARVEPSSFELENHLANQQLPGLDRQGTIQRELTFVEHTHVLFPAIDILHVHAVDMAEGCDTGAE